MNYVKFCPICASIAYKDEKNKISNEHNDNVEIWFFENNRCRECGGSLLETEITTESYFNDVVKKLNTEKANRTILDTYIRPLNMLERNSKVYTDNMLKYYGINLLGEKETIPFSPKCPTCGSTDVRDITSGERFFNALIFGLFGNKRKCRFECLNPLCKYRW